MELGVGGAQLSSGRLQASLRTAEGVETLDPVDLQNGSPSVFSRGRLLRVEKPFCRKRTTEQRKECLEAPGEGLHSQDVSAELLCF